MDQATKERLASEWQAFYAQDNGEIDDLSDKGGADWESLCVGWCLAKGATAKEAFAFYQEMIDLGAF